MASPAKKAGRQARVRAKAVVADFDDISMNQVSQQRSQGSPDDSPGENVTHGKKDAAVPSFLASPEEQVHGNSRSQRKGASVAADFEDISVGVDDLPNISRHQ